MEKYDVVKTEQVRLGRFWIVLDTVNENGKEYPYSYVDLKDSVAVLAKRGSEFVFIDQYRHSIKRYTLEIPGGAIEDGDNPELAARRELQEETGFFATKIRPLGIYYPTVGVANEKCHLFYAECGEQGDRKLEPLEKLSVRFMTVEEIEDAIRANELMHGMALVAWLKYKAGKSNVDRTY